MSDQSEEPTPEWAVFELPCRNATVIPGGVRAEFQVRALVDHLLPFLLPAARRGLLDDEEFIHTMRFLVSAAVDGSDKDAAVDVAMDGMRSFLAGLSDSDGFRDPDPPSTDG
jgi:hypothetical protein